MISVTAPPFFFSCWYTCSLSPSSSFPQNTDVPFLLVFLFSSFSRISAFFLSKSFYWGMNNSWGFGYPLGFCPLPSKLWFCLWVLDPPIGRNRTNVWQMLGIISLDSSLTGKWHLCPETTLTRCTFNFDIQHEVSI